MIKVLASIVNFNSKKNTLACLDLLEKLNTQKLSLTVVVVDNDSSEIFDLNAKYENFHLEIIRSKRNLGFAGGQNLALRFGLERDFEYFLVLNNDIYFKEDLLQELLNTFSKDVNCGIVSPKILFAKGYEFHKDRYKTEDLGKIIWYGGGINDWNNVIASHRGVDEVDKGQFDTLDKTDFASGCCELIKREVLEKSGLFDERFFLYYEDNDLSQRSKKQGFSIYYQPKAKLWHMNAGSTGGSGSKLHDYYISRNRMLFGFKFASFKTKLALIKESVKLLFKGRPWQRKGVLDFYLRVFGKGSYA